MIILFFIFNIFSQNSTFLNTSLLGKGGAFVADVDDVNSVLLNPAGIYMLDSSLIYTSIQINNTAGVTDFTNIYFGNNLDGKSSLDETYTNKSGEAERNSISFLATYITSKNFAFTILSSMIYDLKYNDFTNNNDILVDTFSSLDTTAQVSYSKAFLENDKFRVGASAKTVYRVGKFKEFNHNDLVNIGIFPSTGGKDHVKEGVAILFDLGTQYTWYSDYYNVSYGISVLDLGTPFWINPKLFESSNGAPKLPTKVQTGFGFHVPSLFKSKYSLRTNIDLLKAVNYNEANFTDMLRTGIEFNFPKFLSIRAGLFQNYYTLGFSLKYWVGHIDFATYTENVDIYEGNTRPATRRYVFQFSLNI